MPITHACCVCVSEGFVPFFVSILPTAEKFTCFQPPFWAPLGMSSPWVFNSTVTAELLKWFVKLYWKYIGSLGKGRSGVCSTQAAATSLCKMIQVLKVLVSVIPSNAWPINDSKTKAMGQYIAAWEQEDVFWTLKGLERQCWVLEPQLCTGLEQQLWEK